MSIKGLTVNTQHTTEPYIILTMFISRVGLACEELSMALIGVSLVTKDMYQRLGKQLVKKVWTKLVYCFA